jgi:hypothetical protein
MVGSSGWDLCGANGGTGIGAGHVCICAGRKGHEPYHGVGHGCKCGALWRDAPEVHIGQAEPMMVSNLRYVLDEKGIELTTDILELAVDTTVRFLLSPGQLARVVEETGLSLQSVTEVARCLKKP